MHAKTTEQLYVCMYIVIAVSRCEYIFSLSVNFGTMAKTSSGIWVEKFN